MKNVMKALVLFTMLTVAGFASSVDDEMVMVKKSDLPSNLIAKIETENKLNEVGKWSEMGKEIGSAVRETLSALTEETDRFANTNIGKIATFLVVYKIIGKDILKVVIVLPFAVLFLVVWTVFIIKQFKKDNGSVDNGDLPHGWQWFLGTVIISMVTFLILFV